MKQIHEQKNARLPLNHSLERAILISFVSLLIYLFLTVITTPSLLPLDAIRVTFLVNWWAIIGLTLGIGIQTFLISHFRQECSLKKRRMLTGGSGFVSAFSSFFSFFALIPVGCCGSWLYIISFLPGLIGTGTSGFLIGYSGILSIVGFLLMGLSIVYTFVSMRNTTSKR